MAWPPQSLGAPVRRRDQNLALLGGVVTGAVIAFGLFLLVASRVNPDQGARLRGALLDIVTPVWSAVRGPFDALAAAGDWAGDYLMAVERNRLLEAEVAKVRGVAERRDALARENAALKRLIGVRDPARRVVAAARIAGGAPGSVSRTAVISAGADAGVRPGQPVRAAEGLVGRTVEVGRSAARILMLTDAGSRVPVRVQRGGWPGIAAGVGAPLVEFRWDPPAGAAVKVGDRLVTTGDGGLFPPDVPVAVIVQAGDIVRARPLANPQGLDFVLVEAPWLEPQAPLPLPAARGEGPVAGAVQPQAPVAAPSSATGGMRPAAPAARSASNGIDRPLAAAAARPPAP